MERTAEQLAYRSKQRQCLFYKRRLQRRPTPAETHVKKLLKSLGERYMLHKGLISKNRFYLVDFYLPAPRKLVIEVDGEYHNSLNQIKKDTARDYYITKIRRMHLLRISNRDAFLLNAEDLKRLIVAAT